jgi:hypothetical protein
MAEFMNIIVNEALKAYIDPLTPDEYEALERSILAEGCRDALVLWGEILVDGHNRYAICQKHDLPFQTLQSTQFQSMEDVHLWMIDQHLGRRSVSDFQRGILALRKREIVAERQARALASACADSADVPWDESFSDAPVAAVAAPSATLPKREDFAKAARLTNSQMGMIEKIQKQAAPEVVAAVKSGVISINAAAAVASLPEDEQIAVANAGKDELKLAAKRVREAKRKPREAVVGAVAGAGASGSAASASELAENSASAQVQALQQRVAELTEENEALRQQLAELRARASY